MGFYINCAVITANISTVLSFTVSAQNSVSRQTSADRVVEAQEYVPGGKAMARRVPPRIIDAGSQRIYQSKTFGYMITLPKSYHVISDDRPLRYSDSFACIYAVDSIPNTSKMAEDGRVSRNEIILTYEPVTDYSSRPTFAKLLKLPIKQLLWAKDEGEITNESKQVVTVNGMSMLQVQCDFETTTKYRLEGVKYTTLLYVNGNYLFRVTSKEYYLVLNTENPTIPSGANLHRVSAAKGIQAIKSVKITPI